MSINVTVTGNPVSIRRGKMITNDTSYSKNEFEKRRIMRLEQVRQQSKDIAEDIRTKVRKEKRKHMKHIEEEGREKLRNWQNRKLLELQTQYKNALQEIGIGHKEAESLVDEQEILEELKEHNQQVSIQRGHEASTKLQLQKNEESLKKCIPIQRKKIVRDIENNRANIVSNQKTNKKKSNIHINIPDSETTGESESGSKVSADNNLVNMPHSSEDTCDCSEDSERPRSPLKSNKINEEDPVNQELKPDLHPISTQVSEAHLGRSPFYIQNRICLSPAIDTRISDRIRQRNVLTTQPDYCDIAGYQSEFNDHNCIKTSETNNGHPMKDLNFKPSHLQHTCNCGRTVEPEKTVCNICKCGALVKNKENIRHPEFLSCPCHFCPCSVPIDRSINTEIQKRDQAVNTSKQNAELQDSQIPTKPPIRLKQTTRSSSVASKETSKVHYYNHSNRFSAEKEMPSNSFVERITGDSLEVNPNKVSEEEFYRKMAKRDKEVQMRCKKAVEQQKIQKDYEEMLKKLPLLQKKERIAEIRKDKPEYHMNDERLKELERKRQNEMDNAFNKAFPNLKPAVVTLPKSQPTQDTKINMHRLENSDNEMVIAQWDVDGIQPKIFTAQEVQDIVKAFTDQNISDRRLKLKELLQTLKLQKEQLIQEIKSLPRDESINELLNDINSIDDVREPEVQRRGEKMKPERKRPREENDNELSIDSSSSSNSNCDIKRHQKSVRRHKVGRGKKSYSPRKKVKSKHYQKVIILQNTSTQTTPKVVTKCGSNNNVEVPSKTNIDKSVQKEICTKQHVPCTCKSAENATSEELCEIFIKLDDTERPQVVVKPKGKDDLHSEIASKALKSVGIGTDEPLSPKKSDQFVTPVNDNIGNISRTGKKQTRSKKNATTKKSEVKHGLFESDKNKRKPWREELSKNSISTTSTSYMSPPDLQNAKNLLYNNLLPSTIRKTFESKKSKDTSVIKTMEGKNIATYINNLLSMSRASVDNLNSSSTSSVTTPSQSVIEIEFNVPNAQLIKLIKLVNLNVDRQLDYSPDFSTIHFNTSASEVSIKTEEKCSEFQDQTSVKGSGQPEEILLEQYTNITKSCSKRIANLAEMIKKIREEKIQILQPSSSGSSSSKQSSSSDFDEEEMFKQLTEIDMSLAKKLKSMTDANDQKKKKKVVLVTPTKPVDGSPEFTDSNKEFLARLERLKQRDPSEIPDGKSDGNKETVFVPFLSDIPKLPKFEPQLGNGTQNKNNHRHPPPSKGLSVARKYNENISLVPHELSTIVEADSQLSARITTSPTSKTSFSPFKDVELIVIPNISNSDEDVNKQGDEKKRKFPPNKSKSSPVHEINDIEKIAEFMSKSESSPNSLKPDSVNDKKQTSNSSNDLEAIEEMLKSIGMDWAIPTIHKTKEALALTSTSSSSESSIKHFDMSLLSDFSEFSAVQLGQLSVEKTRPRTSTPVTTSKSTSKSKDSSNQLVYSEESDISSVRKELEIHR